ERRAAGGRQEGPALHSKVPRPSPESPARQSRAPRACASRARISRPGITPRTPSACVSLPTHTPTCTPLASCEGLAMQSSGMGTRPPSLDAPQAPPQPPGPTAKECRPRWPFCQAPAEAWLRHVWGGDGCVRVCRGVHERRGSWLN
ncbi:hypothetical protein TSOC_010721, partial [Tetrabaena socialis]